MEHLVWRCAMWDYNYLWARQRRNTREEWRLCCRSGFGKLFPSSVTQKQPVGNARAILLAAAGAHLLRVDLHHSFHTSYLLGGQWAIAPNGTRGNMSNCLVGSMNGFFFPVACEGCVRTSRVLAVWKDNLGPSRIGSPAGVFRCSPLAYPHRTALPPQSGTHIVPQFIIGLQLSWPPFTSSWFRGLWAPLSPCRSHAYEPTLVLTASPSPPCRNLGDNLIQSASI